jgi:small subunit ribosomal protein S16
MAVHIRLQRHGSHNKPFYHVVAADHRCARNGKFLEKLGTYDPKISPAKIVLKSDRMQEWFGKGAVLSNTVANLVKIQKLELTRNKAAVKPAKAKKAAAKK